MKLHVLFVESPKKKKKKKKKRKKKGPMGRCGSIIKRIAMEVRAKEISLIVGLSRLTNLAVADSDTAARI